MSAVHDTTELSDLNGGWDPQTVVIRHGIFWYFAAEKQPLVNERTKRIEEKLGLVQRIANQNETITIVLESDYQRGVMHHAFWTEDELNSAQSLRDRESAHGAIAPTQEPLSVQAPSAGQLAARSAAEDEDIKGPLDYDLNEFEESGDLIEWLQGTGTFDGMRRPNAGEVIRSAHGDKALAARLLEAEPLARGDEGSRETVVKGLSKIIED